MSAKAIESGEGVATDTFLQEFQWNGECPQGGAGGGGGPGLGVHGPGQRGLSSGLELPLRYSGQISALLGLSLPLCEMRDLPAGGEVSLSLSVFNLNLSPNVPITSQLSCH